MRISEKMEKFAMRISETPLSQVPDLEKMRETSCEERELRSTNKPLQKLKKSMGERMSESFDFRPALPRQKNPWAKGRRALGVDKGKLGLDLSLL